MTASAVTTTRFTSHDEPRPRLTLLRADDRAPETIRVAVAEGHRLVRAGVSALLEREAGIAAAGEAARGEEAVALTRRLRPDVALIDVQLSGLDCGEATRMMLADPGVAVMLRRLRERRPRLRAHRHHRKQSPWEDAMLTPNVIEIRRGCAHGATVGLAKATAASSQHAE